MDLTEMLSCLRVVVSLSRKFGRLCVFQKIWKKRALVIQKFCLIGPEILDQVFHLAEVRCWFPKIWTRCYGLYRNAVLMVSRFSARRLDLAFFNKQRVTVISRKSDNSELVIQKFCLNGPEILDQLFSSRRVRCLLPKIWTRFYIKLLLNITFSSLHSKAFIYRGIISAKKSKTSIREFCLYTKLSILLKVRLGIVQSIHLQPAT
jgi:hypothetical protein